MTLLTTLKKSIFKQISSPISPSRAPLGPQVGAWRPLLATVRAPSQIFIDFWSHFGGLGAVLGVHFGVLGTPVDANCLQRRGPKLAKVVKKWCQTARWLKS